MSIKETLYTFADKLGLTATIVAVPANLFGSFNLNEIFTYCISMLSVVWLVLKIQNELLSKKRLRQTLQTEKYVSSQNKDQS